MFFPVANLEVSPWIPPAVAFGISLFTSMGGVSGAFLLLPFQVSVLGFVSPAVSATNQLFNVIAIPSGVYRYVREGRMAWPLTWAVVIGTLPGVLIGAVLRVRWLPDPRNFKLFAGLALLYIGGRLAASLLRRPRPGGSAAAEAQFARRMTESRHARHGARRDGANDAQGALPRIVAKRFGPWRIVYEFAGQTFDVSAAGVMALSLIVGMVGGVYGIGGGSIIAPFFVGVFGLPVYTVAGAALMGTFVTSVAGVAFYQALAPFHPGVAVAPDWGLGLLFGTGGALGMYCGARLQKHAPARPLKWLLVVCIAIPAIKYVWEFFGH